MDHHVRFDQLNLFLIYTVLRRTHLFTFRSLSRMFVVFSSIIDMSWPFPKHCFRLACFKLLLLSIAWMICFSSCLRVSSFIFHGIALQISEYLIFSISVPFLFIVLRVYLRSLLPVDSLSCFSCLHMPAIEMAPS